MIQMVCGACRVGDQLKRAADGPFTLSPEVEQRLVDAGAATYVISMTPADLAREETDEPGIVDGHFTEEGLTKLSRRRLEQLAAELEVDINKCRNKTDIVSLLVAVEVQSEEGADDDEAPSALGAADPVVN